MAIDWSNLPKTKAPTGLTVSRNDNNVILSWKIGDADYDWGQTLYYQFKLVGDPDKSWKSPYNKGIVVHFADSKTTSFTLAIPSNMERVDFAIRGQRKPSGNTTYEYSPYAVKSYSLAAPDVPSLSQSLSSDYTNVTTFTWDTTVNENDNKPFRHVEWQTILVKECATTDGSKLSWGSRQTGWGTGTASRSSSITREEDTALLAQNSYTRWVRVRSIGTTGLASAWRYAKHVYAMPWVPTINKAVKEGSLNWIRVNWTAGQNAAHPIDVVTVDWTIDTPLANRAIPANPSWTTARTIKDTTDTDEVLFLVDQALENDECLWVRIGVQHDREWRATDAKYVYGAKLSAPSGLSVTTNNTTYRAEITATNNSDVPDSKLAVVLRRTGQADIIVGVSTAGSGQKNLTVQCPNWSGSNEVAFGVFAFQGTATEKAMSGSPGYNAYSITSYLRSDTTFEGGSVPFAPSSVTATITETEGEVLLEWDWPWTKATLSEISWSRNPNAWESTDDPETYTINDLHMPRWRVSNLEVGAIWYFRIRLAREYNDEITYGPYSEPVAVNLLSALNPPILTLSEATIQEGNTFTASWTYAGAEGDTQTYAEICEATVTGDTITYGEIIAHTATEQHMEITAPDTWTMNTEHSLCVRTTSASTVVSEWSDPVMIAVVEPITCEITETSFGHPDLMRHPYHDDSLERHGITWTVNSDWSITANGTPTSRSFFDLINGTATAMTLSKGTYILKGCPPGGSSRTYSLDFSNAAIGLYVHDYGEGAVFTLEQETTITYCSISIYNENGSVSNLTFRPQIESELGQNILKSMPLTATVTGAGDGGITTLSIERADDYFMARPDETVLDGYEGETIASITQEGENQMSIGLDKLIGRLDDGAPYRLIATTQDGYGQTASASIDFFVKWTHQAGIPSAEVQIDSDSLIAKITPSAPANAEEDDVVDIYRLSADRPELIVSGGSFGETYVDPYPAIGESGGHRIVCRTVNGDYITYDNRPAWIDTGRNDQDILDVDYAIIDFAGERIGIPYDVVLDNSWAKDFQQTTYLGGAIQGDWNPAVSRTGSISASILTDDMELVQALRRLATYAGICHVRTQDGSSYAADIQVNDGISYDKAGKIIEMSLTITRVDPESLDGMTLEEWEGGQ